MNRKRILQLMAIAFLIISSCKKVKSDYRKPYLGKFNFYVQISSYTMGSPWGEYDTSEYHYFGEINMKGDSSILIPKPKGDTTEFYVSNTGKLKYICSSIFQNSYVIGKISENSLSLVYDDDICTSGPIGGSWEIKMTATK